MYFQHCMHKPEAIHSTKLSKIWGSLGPAKMWFTWVNVPNLLISSPEATLVAPGIMFYAILWADSHSLRTLTWNEDNIITAGIFLLVSGDNTCHYSLLSLLLTSDRKSPRWSCSTVTSTSSVTSTLCSKKINEMWWPCLWYNGQVDVISSSPLRLLDTNLLSLGPIKSSLNLTLCLGEGGGSFWFWTQALWNVIWDVNGNHSAFDVIHESLPKWSVKTVGLWRQLDITLDFF